MNKEEIILIGGGGHCNSCIDVIETENKYRIEGIIDVAEKLGQKLLGYPIIGTDDDLENLANKYPNFLITIGHLNNPETRIKLFDTLRKLSVTLPVIISPHAYVSKHSTIGAGTIVMHNSLINANVTIGSNCIINSNSLVEHDAIIDDHCHISTAAVINGGVKVGTGTFYGSGAISKQYIDIPPNSFVKANSIVT